MDEVKDERLPEEKSLEERNAAGLPSSRKGSVEGKASVNHPLVELTLTRIREFLREREALFWVFVFPVLLAFALGIAFRNAPPEKQRVAVEKSGTGANDATANEIARVLSSSAEVEPLLLSPAEAAQALRSGKVSMIVRPRRESSESNQPGTASAPAEQPAQANQTALTGELDYQFDPTRPESKVARLAVDDALQRALGRDDVMIAREQKTVEPERAISIF